MIDINSMNEYLNNINMYQKNYMLVLGLTVISIILSFMYDNILILFYGVLSLLAINIYQSAKCKKKPKEAYTPFTVTNHAEGDETQKWSQFYKDTFYNNTSNNPYGNVLLPEINENPDRKAAPPAFNPTVQEDNKNLVKQAIQKLNPTIKDTNKQLFGSLVDIFNFNQFDRLFYSTANTKVPNDQGAFAKFLYGDMPSCKDGNSFACMQDNMRYIMR